MRLTTFGYLQSQAGDADRRLRARRGRSLLPSRPSLCAGRWLTKRSHQASDELPLGPSNAALLLIVRPRAHPACMAAQATKRPHFVPECYLRPWANDSDQVAVRRRAAPAVITPNVRNVAVEAGLYGRGEDGQAREAMFGALEGGWPEARSALLAAGGEIDGDLRALVALFAAVQLVRTREHLAQAQFIVDLAEFAPTRPVSRDDVRCFLAERHLRFPPDDCDVEGAWTIACVALNGGETPTGDSFFATPLGIAVEQLAPRRAASLTMRSLSSSTAEPSASVSHLASWRCTDDFDRSRASVLRRRPTAGEGERHGNRSAA
jgi:Protein of unknown function (DUF4238)